MIALQVGEAELPLDAENPVAPRWLPIEAGLEASERPDRVVRAHGSGEAAECRSGHTQEIERAQRVGPAEANIAKAAIRFTLLLPGLAGPAAAKVAPDIEASPIIDRRHDWRGWGSLVSGSRTQVCGIRRTGGNKCRTGNG